MKFILHSHATNSNYTDSADLTLAQEIVAAVSRLVGFDVLFPDRQQFELNSTGTRTMKGIKFSNKVTSAKEVESHAKLLENSASCSYWIEKSKSELDRCCSHEWCCTSLFEHVWLDLLYLLGGRDQHVLFGCRKMAPDNNAPFMGGTRHDLQRMIADSNEDTVITDTMNELRFACPPDAARVFPLQHVVTSTRCVPFVTDCDAESFRST